MTNHIFSAHVGRVKGAAVLDAAGQSLGSIGELKIDKLDGTIRGVIVLFGGVLGIGATQRELPWHALAYEPTLDAYVLRPAWIDTEESQAALVVAPTAPA